MTQKSIAFIINNNNQLLCFKHPVTDFLESIRGTIETGEEPENCIVRELLEEAGIHEKQIKSITFWGDKTMEVPTGFDRKGSLELQKHYGYKIKLIHENFTEISHHVKSKGIDNGYFYEYKWYNIDEELFKNLNPSTLVLFKTQTQNNQH